MGDIAYICYMNILYYIALMLSGSKVFALYIFTLIAKSMCALFQSQKNFTVCTSQAQILSDWELELDNVKGV